MKLVHRLSFSAERVAKIAYGRLEIYILNLKRPVLSDLIAKSFQKI